MTSERQFPALRSEETLRYGHVAEAHGRETPPELLKAAEGIYDPDKRMLVMVGARCSIRHLVAPEVEAAKGTEGTAVEVGHQVGTKGVPEGGGRVLQVV